MGAPNDLQLNSDVIEGVSAGPGAYAQAVSRGGSPSAADDRPGSATNRKRDGSPTRGTTSVGASVRGPMSSPTSAHVGAPKSPRISGWMCAGRVATPGEGRWGMTALPVHPAERSSGLGALGAAKRGAPHASVGVARPPDPSCSSNCRCHRTGANSAVGCRSRCGCARPDTAGDRGPAHRPGCTMGRHRRPTFVPALACATWPPRGPRAPCAQGPHAPRRRPAPAPMALRASLTRQLHQVRTVDAVDRPVHARHQQVERDIDPTMGTGGVIVRGVGRRTG